MAETRQKNLGHATAYAYAKSMGYSGTEEEFAELLAGQATIAERTEEERLKAEGYALGTQEGVVVEEGSSYYHNNAVYFSGQAAQEVVNAQAEVLNAKAEVQNAKDEVVNAKAEVQNAKAEVNNAKAEVQNAKAEVANAKAEADRAAGVVASYGMHAVSVADDDYKLYVGAAQ